MSQLGNYEESREEIVVTGSTANLKEPGVNGNRYKTGNHPRSNGLFELF
jgi:hypothetical protein